MSQLIANFNEIGLSMFRITNQENLAKLKKSENEIKAMAQQEGFHMPPKFLEALKYSIDFGYQDMIDIQMTVGQSIFSAPLRRECLRETESMLIQKYSRFSDMPMTLLGTITKNGAKKDKPQFESTSEVQALKVAIRSLTDRMADIEETFTGALTNEFIVDPIAIYLDL